MKNKERIFIVIGKILIVFGTFLLNKKSRKIADSIFKEFKESYSIKTSDTMTKTLYTFPSIKDNKFSCLSSTSFSAQCYGINYYFTADYRDEFYHFGGIESLKREKMLNLLWKKNV